MSDTNSICEKVAVEQDVEQHAVDEQPELEATVELETQAKIDSDVRDRVAAADKQGRPHGMTLEAQEKWEAREAEKRRTREREDRQQTSRREALCREMTHAKHCELSSEADPREKLDEETRQEVNKQAHRLEGKCRGGLGFAAIERELAARVVRGRSMQDAVLDLVEDVQAAPGSIVALGKLEKVSRQWVDVEATVAELWIPSHPSMQQVGLLEDETGRTKVTVWRNSGQPPLEEGQQVRIRDAAVSWYQGRPSLALTGRSTVHFPERDAWW
ncbi:DNA-binding protein [Natronomonas salina]|uniref:DNA-binding protein n=1 Tax=Natronomonas salina TaxID=1710540 RepID=UPI0015B47321|nr:DNA-binding protein [Natronomonas salina]QLD89606.1 DNA-binding protein [Natronomonas salina]